MPLTDQAFLGGFASPVIDAQAHFKSVMCAMSQPGAVIPVRQTVHAPVPLRNVAGAVALTLCDADTPIYLDQKLRDDAVMNWLRFHTGAPITDNKVAAQFAIMDGCEALNALECFALGTQEYPDRSTTLIIQISGFAADPHWTLCGPGIDGSTQITPSDAPNSVLAYWARNTALFPRGVDVIFAAPDALAALSRTTKITLSEGA